MLLLVCRKQEHTTHLDLLVGTTNNGEESNSCSISCAQPVLLNFDFKKAVVDCFGLGRFGSRMVSNCHLTSGKGGGTNVSGTLTPHGPSLNSIVTPPPPRIIIAAELGLKMYEH